MADLVNTYEDSYSSFDLTSLTGTISKQSVTLVDAPSTGSYSSVISQLQRLGVKAVYISNVPDSDPDLPVQLSKFVSEVASAIGVRGFPEERMCFYTTRRVLDSLPLVPHLPPHLQAILSRRPKPSVFVSAYKYLFSFGC
jgi:hypothetical protein